MAQNFYGPVGQVAAGDIRNRGDRQSNIDRQERWNDLVARQQEHIALRSAAQRRRWANPYLWWFGAGMAAFLALVWEGHLVFGSAVSLSLSLVAGAWALFSYGLFQHVQRACAAEWRYHNEAIADINRALHVL
jgi:hypothetical protein